MALLACLATIRWYPDHLTPMEVLQLVTCSPYTLQFVALAVRAKHPGLDRAPENEKHVGLLKEVMWAVAPRPFLRIVGGIRLANGVASPYVYRFEPHRARWTNVGSMILGAEGASVVPVGSAAYVVAGGHDRIAWPKEGQMRVYRVPHECMQVFFGGQASVLHRLPGPRPLGTSVHVLDGILHVVGRMTAQGPCGLDSLAAPLRPDKGVVWRPRSPMGVARMHAACASAGGLLYVAGGRGPSPESVTGAFECYDAAVDTWTCLPTMGTPRSHAGAAVVGGKVYVCGGADRTGSPLATVECYNPTAGKWQQLPPLSTARALPACAALGGQLYAIGGTTHDNVATMRVERYDPRTGMWQQKDGPTDAVGNVGVTSH